MRVLLIEDDALIGQAIQQALKDAAYALNWARDGKLGLAAARSEEYDVILLDLGLPKQGGFEILQTLRDEKNAIPVIITTARDQIEDRIKGLDLGADDYLVKPFSIAELQARIRAVTRRNQGAASALIRTRDLTLNTASCEVSRGADTHALSAREFALLQALMLRPGKVFSRSDLEERMYGWDEEVASNAVEFIIHGLRKKLGKDAIKNIRGLGWMVSQ